MEQRKQNWGKGCDGKSSSKFDKSEKWVNKVWHKKTENGSKVCKFAINLLYLHADKQ